MPNRFFTSDAARIKAYEIFIIEVLTALGQTSHSHNDSNHELINKITHKQLRIDGWQLMRNDIEQPGGLMTPPDWNT